MNMKNIKKIWCEISQILKYGVFGDGREQWATRQEG